MNQLEENNLILSSIGYWIWFWKCSTEWLIDTRILGMHSILITNVYCLCLDVYIDPIYCLPLSTDWIWISLNNWTLHCHLWSIHLSVHIVTKVVMMMIHCTVIMSLVLFQIPLFYNDHCIHEYLRLCLYGCLCSVSYINYCLYILVYGTQSMS